MIVNLKMSSVPPCRKPHTGPAAAWCHSSPAVSFPSAILKNSTTFCLKSHPHLHRHTGDTVFRAHTLY